MRIRLRRESGSWIIFGVWFVVWPSWLAADEPAPTFESMAGRLITPVTDRAVQRGLAFLAAQQGPEGSLGEGEGRNVGVVGLVGMSWLAAGSTPTRGPYARQLDRGLKYVLDSGQESGYLTARSPTGLDTMYGHGFATMFLAECCGMSRRPELRPRLRQAVALTIRAQNDAGGWRYEPRPRDADVSVTSCQLMALRAAKNVGVAVPSETIERAVEYLISCQNGDGGFAYQASDGRESAFPRTAAVVTALYGSGLARDAVVDRGLRYLRQQAPQNSDAGRDGYYFYGQYYAAQAFWQAGGDQFLTWYATTRDKLLSQQAEDGSWSDPLGRTYATAMATLVLQLPNNVLPIFRR